jgi:predicted GTPase
MDYHMFNRVFRDNPFYEVVAFTACAEQNLGTCDGDASLRTYPPVLAGKLYPQGIPTVPESKLYNYVQEQKIDIVCLSYSDLPYQDAMRKASIALPAGANFWLTSPHRTMIKAHKPVVGVCAVRTGCGKSQTSTKVAMLLKGMGKRVVAIREPMPYGDLSQQIVMRFATYADLDKHKCTIEEREEYEQYVERGLVIYSGVDYERVLEEVEKEADVIVWDGGNNEVPFYYCNVLFVVADPLRAGHEINFYPGEVNAHLATHFIINKENSAKPENIVSVEKNLRQINPRAVIIHADSVVSVDEPEKVKGKKVLVVEDGPTLTHGNMSYGAGILAAKQLGCTVVDPRKSIVGTMKKVFEDFPHVETSLPAMGYNKQQLDDLEASINNADCEAVLSGTPFDLAKLIKIKKPCVRVRYAVEEKEGSQKIADILKTLF